MTTSRMGTFCRTLVVVASFLTVQSAGFAQLGSWCINPLTPPPPSSPRPCQAGPSGNGTTSSNSCSTCTGSPCYVATGGYTTEAQDLSISTVGFNLTVTRHYESSSPVDSGIGLGWSISLFPRAVVTTFLFAAPSTFKQEADVILPNGSHLQFAQNPDGSFAPPSNRYDTLVQNADSSFDLTMADGTTKYHFGAGGRLDTITDAFGNALTYTYDMNSRLQRIADSSGSGRYIDVYYGGDGRVSTIRDHTSRAITYSYNANGTLNSITDPLNRVTSYTYTPVRSMPLLTRITDPWGRVITDITYDSLARTATYTENGETYTYAYNYNYYGNNLPNQSSKVDSIGNRWVYTYTTDGPISQRIFPGSASAQVVYNSDRSIQMATDEVGVKTYYTYTSMGRLSSVTKDYQGSLAVRFDYTYDANFPNAVTSILPKNPTTNAYDTSWQGWQYDYYQAGSTAPAALWHVKRVRDDGATADTLATYEYDSHGRVTAVTDATGGRTDYAYDATGNLSTVTAPTNNDSGVRPVITYGYDLLGRVTSVTDALNHQTTYTYDAADRVLTVTLPKPSPSSTLNFTTTYAYDSYDAGSQLLATSVTDPNGNVTTQKYDVFGRLTKSVDAAGNTTSYGYTRAVLSSITDANGYATSYSYDGLGRLTKMTFADGAFETYAYFGDGLLQSKTDRKNQTVQYTYDRLKRLSVKESPNSMSIYYTYVGQKLTEVSDHTLSPFDLHTLTYDTQYRLASNAQGFRGTISYTYDAADRTASYAISNGPAATYAYYPDGSLNTIQWTPVAGQFKYAYTLSGKYGTITFPNGQTRSYIYDDQGRLFQLANTHPTIGNLATYAYGYDLNNSTGLYTMLGQRTSVTATVPTQSFSSALTKYYYDSRYELTRVDYPAAAPFNSEAHSWTYDTIGNRLTNTINGATANYTYQKIGANPNNWQRLLSDGTNNYTYDANGNTATRTGYTFGWDYENRMTSMSGAPNASYAYDYSGRRSSKTVSGLTTVYLYDGVNLIAGTTGGATVYHLLGPGIDEPLATSNGTSTVNDAVDGLGSVILSADATGTAQNSYVYDGWGVSRSSTETFAQPFRYSGREQGDGSDQLFYRARLLAPTTGRFLSEDLAPTDFSPYAYVENAPVLYGDPLGLERVSRPYPPSPRNPMRNPPTRACLRSFQRLIELFEQLDPGPGSDSWKHCRMGCEISGVCGDWATLFIALAKETADAFTRGRHSELRDVNNTLKGGQCANKPEGCSCCCKNLENAHQLE